ncbi:MAG: restriction endonuclease subunit S [Thermomicrobiales bacterium]
MTQSHPAGYPAIPLGEVLAAVSRPTTVEPNQDYRLLGARWYANGLFVKDIKPGSGIQARTLYRVEAGDFVYNRLFAWKGSFAVATEVEAGAFVSNEFPCFRADPSRLDSRYLQLYFTRESAWNEALGLSTGGTPTSRNRLKEQKLLAMRIPLPPLAEQRRIVARIEEVAGKIEEARGLRRAAMEEREALAMAIVFEGSGGSAEPTPMREIVQPRAHDVVVEKDETYHFAGVYSFGRGVFRGQNRSGIEFSYPRLGRLRTGDFVYPKLMAWEGALGVVPTECDGLFVSPEFPIFEIDENRALPETLDVYFRTPEVWPRIAGSSTGTNVRRRRLQPSEFLAFEMPLPPMSIQIRLRTVLRETEPLKQLQAETEAELEALLPAVLERAFRGEL